MRPLLLTFMMLLSVAISTAAPPSKGAIIKVDSVAHDFGQVSRKGADIVHTFKVSNVGDAPLVITEAATTCTCLKVKYPKRPISPDKSADVVVQYEVQRKEEGPFHKIIKLMSNSVEDGGCLVLTIHGVSVEEKSGEKSEEKSKRSE